MTTDHLTLAFNPDDEQIKRFEGLMGTEVKLRAIAYGEDEHSQSVSINCVPIIFMSTLCSIFAPFAFCTRIHARPCAPLSIFCFPVSSQVLVEFPSGETKSANKFAHVTLSSEHFTSDEGDYTAKYSNVMWERLNELEVPFHS